MGVVSLEEEAGEPARAVSAVGGHEKRPPSATRKKTLTEPTASTLFSDLQPPELWEINVCCGSRSAHGNWLQ